MTRQDIADILAGMPKATKAEMREAVRKACEAEGQTHNPQGHPVWEALEGYEDYDKAVD